MKKQQKNQPKLPSVLDFLEAVNVIRKDGLTVLDPKTGKEHKFFLSMKDIAESDYCNPDGIYSENDTLEIYLEQVYDCVMKRIPCDTYDKYCEGYSLWHECFEDHRKKGEDAPKDSDLPWFALCYVLEYWASFDAQWLFEQSTENAKTKRVPNLKLIKN